MQSPLAWQSACSRSSKAGFRQELCPILGLSVGLGEKCQQLFIEFSQTLVQLRTVSTEGQQKLETARTRPQ